jgi:uroporphyrinogen-III decarboxylase
VGDFDAITWHRHGDGDPNDCHWEKRYVETLEDFVRIANAERRAMPFDVDGYNKGCREIGGRGVPVTGVLHALGRLVRSSKMEEAYAWFVSEPATTHAFLENTTCQVVESLLALRDVELADPPVFTSGALEMLTPPWLGKKHFAELVFPYDKRVNDAIHAIGGRHRAHCHGNSGDFLELFADMGIDSVEPLEPPPFGDNVLADAKRKVGQRMLLSGNVPSQAFYRASADEVRDMVKRAIDDGAPGGGFTLRPTSGGAGLGKTREQAIDSIQKHVVYIEAAMEYR